ncbi:protein NLRC3-like [Hibiscus syriacus]|uniref:Protein NLRC3-like n=1 Tax=Hibiscus syriacus TaxID=106335 RepID=A0A6A3B493_HIBSY|nr:protein NLRC3-like [Hibiscus syriacus]
MENKQFKGHVIVVPYPSQGHINPLLQFAKRLASKGVKKTLATTRYIVGSICALQIGVESISDGFHKGSYSQAGNVEHAGTSVTCVVYDSFLPWAIDVAKQQGIHGSSFFTNSAAVCSIFSRIHRGLLALPFTPETTPLMLPGLPPLNFHDLPTFLRFPDSYPVYLAMKLSQFSTLNKGDWVSANTFEDLEREEAKGASELWRAKMIGPMAPSAYLDERTKGYRGYDSSLWKPLSEECMEWLETKPSKSVVYISFGSMVSLTEEERKRKSTVACKERIFETHVQNELESNAEKCRLIILVVDRFEKNLRTVDHTSAAVSAPTNCESRLPSPSSILFGGEFRSPVNPQLEGFSEIVRVVGCMVLPAILASPTFSNGLRIAADLGFEFIQVQSDCLRAI